MGETTRGPPPALPPKPTPVGDGYILPSQILADRYFDQLFHLLTLPPPLCTDVWDLLMKLPTNRQMENRLKDINVCILACNSDTQPDTNWDTVLDTRNVFKLYYSLQIADALMQTNGLDEATALERQRYREHFVACGGLKHMMQILLHTDFLGSSLSDQGSSKKLVCLALVLRITLFLLGDGNNKLDKGKTFRRQKFTHIQKCWSVLTCSSFFRDSWNC